MYSLDFISPFRHVPNAVTNRIMYQISLYHRHIVHSVFICLFGFFPSHSRIFHSYREVTTTGEGWVFWAVRVFLTCHAYCETGDPFIMVIFVDPWHFHLLPSVWQWSSQYLFKRLKSVAAWMLTSTLLHATLNHFSTVSVTFNLTGFIEWNTVNKN